MKKPDALILGKVNESVETKKLPTTLPKMFYKLCYWRAISCEMALPEVKSQPNNIIKS